MRAWNKVFEVGSPKTGTTSLGIAFEMLGLRHIGYRRHLYEKCQNGDYVETLQTAKHYDAFRDAPWHADGMYKIFDEVFPNSKFILLERDIESWTESYENHFSAANHPRRTRRTVIENFEAKRAEIIRRHLARYDEIKGYFKDRPNDLLVMDICAGEGWEKLCPFLGLPIPNEEFPHGNRRPGALKKTFRLLRTYSPKPFKKVIRKVDRISRRVLRQR